jgi:hypothetical protein
MRWGWIVGITLNKWEFNANMATVPGDERFSGSRSFDDRLSIMSTWAILYYGGRISMLGIPMSPGSRGEHIKSRDPGKEESSIVWFSTAMEALSLKNGSKPTM